MYGTNFIPKIFTDITMPDIKFYSPHTAKKTQYNEFIVGGIKHGF